MSDFPVSGVIKSKDALKKKVLEFTLEASVK